MNASTVTHELRAIRDLVDGQLLTASEAARFLGISRATFFRLKIPPTVRPSPRTPRWSREDLAKKVNR